MKSGIYRINLGNGNAYIGSACDVAKRERDHLRSLRAGRHDNERVQRAWDKYQVFEFTILEYCERSELLDREQHYLDLHFDDPKNLNICRFAWSVAGYKHTDKTKDGMSVSHKESTKSKAHLLQVNASKLEVPLSHDHKAHLSESLKNSPKAKAQLEQLHRSQIGVPLTADHKAKKSKAAKASLKVIAHAKQLQEWWRGREHTDVTKEKMRLAQQRRRIREHEAA